MAILKRLALVIVSILVVVAVKFAIGHFTGTQAANKELDSHKVGECVTMSKSGSGVGNVELTSSGCDADPSYTVASRIDAGGTCPTESYSEYSLTVNNETAGKLCLVENLTVDHCYETEFMTNVTILDADCSGGLSSANPFKVVSRTESADASCPETSTAVSFPEPARTYCVEPVETLG